MCHLSDLLTMLCISFFQNWHMLAQKAVNVEDSENGGVSGSSNANMDDAFLLIQQITANIVSYCQVAMTLGGIYKTSECDMFQQ